MKRGTCSSAVSNLRIFIFLTVALASVSVGLLATAKQHWSGRTGFREAPGPFIPEANRGALGRQWFWQNPLPQGNDLRGVSFIDANTANLVGAYGTIIRTTDAGSSWTIETSGTTETLWAVSFADVNDGTVVGEGGTILTTTDGGEHWTSRVSGTTFQLRGVSFIDANNATAVGAAGTILRSTDGGNTWDSQSS